MNGYSLATVLTIVGILLAIFFFIIGLYYWIWHRREDSYEKEIERLTGLAFGGNHILKSENIGEIKSQKLSSLINRKIDGLKNGIVELTVQEISETWSGMFAEKNIIWFRATSYISPYMWKDPFMSIYEEQQRANIDSFNDLEEKEKGRCIQTRASLIPVPEDELGVIDFERIFIITREQSRNSDMLFRLIKIICAQSEYMHVHIANEEDILPYKEDFGITISREGDVLLYDLIPNLTGDSLLGGRLILNKSRKTDAFRKYASIRGNSVGIQMGARFDDVVNVIKELFNGQIDTDELSKIMSKEQEVRKEFHKCIGCFIESEKTLINGKWKDLPVAKRRWYEMLEIENRMVSDYVIKHKPRNILEVGCGPGRLIEVIERVVGFKNINEIVGIESDRQMYNYARKRWKNNSKVKLINMRVDQVVPYPVEDYFDFCINAMNIVGWQENERQWLEEMLRCSKVVFFTIYKKGFENERIKMYEQRKHRVSGTGVHLDQDGQIVLGDCAVIPDVVSKAHTKPEVEELCKKISNKYEIDYTIDDKSNELLYICYVSKK